MEFNKDPQNLRQVMDSIIELVPEAESQHDNIYALIKTYEHFEKYCLWSNLKHWVDDKQSFLYRNIVAPKIETHNKDNWCNFERNLEWVKQYQSFYKSFKSVIEKDTEND